MASLATESLPPPVTTPSIPDEPLRRLRPTTSLGALAGVPIRFARTADGAHLAYVVVGPSDHAKPSEKKRKGKMRSTRAVTTPLVMLPGLGMVKEDWGDFAYELSKSRLCLLPDYRGMGDSLLPNQPLPLDAQGNFIPSSSLSNFDPPKALDDFYESTRATKLPRLATDVLEIIRDLFWSKEAHGGKPWKRFNLLGHGMGGAVAQTMSLVIMDGSPFANQAFISEFDPNDAKREGLGLEHLVLLGSSARASNQFGGGVFEALAKGDMGQVGDLFSHGPEKEAVISIFRTGRRPRVIIEKQFLSLTSYDYIDDNPVLALFSLPALVVHGQHDTQVPYLEGFLVHKRIRGSYWKRVEGGHWLHVGKLGEETLRYVSAFLRDDWDGKAKL